MGICAFFQLSFVRCQLPALGKMRLVGSCLQLWHEHAGLCSLHNTSALVWCSDRTGIYTLGEKNNFLLIVWAGETSPVVLRMSHRFHLVCCLWFVVTPWSNIKKYWEATSRLLKLIGMSFLGRKGAIYWPWHFSWQQLNSFSLVVVTLENFYLITPYPVGMVYEVILASLDKI